MTSRVLVRRKMPQVQSDTPSSQGNFDTAARADAFAARMRNMTTSMGSLCRGFDTDQTNTPSDYPEIFDQPQ